MSKMHYQKEYLGNKNTWTGIDLKRDGLGRK